MEPNLAYERREDVVFLDVRTDQEYQAGHIADSLHIPLQELPDRKDELDGDRPVVVVCQVGQRSGLAASFLAEHGYDASNLDGGLESWVASGFPLVAGDNAPGKAIDGRAQYLEW